MGRGQLYQVTRKAQLSVAVSELAVQGRSQVGSIDWRAWPWGGSSQREGWQEVGQGRPCPSLLAALWVTAPPFPEGG